jgi:hypothetical protein
VYTIVVLHYEKKLTMIRVFRNIRQGFFSESKSGIPLNYAVTEVILVVIGILIALSIDNWNESAKEKKIAEKLIVRINNQVSQNLGTTDRKILGIEKRLEDMIILMSMIGNPDVDLSEKLLDSLILNSWYDFNIGLDLNSLLEAQANGEIALIKKDSLRIALYKLSAIVNYIENRESIVNNENNNFYVPHIYKKVNIRNIPSNRKDDYRKSIGYSKLDHTDYSKLLMDREFENLLDSRIYYSQEILIHYRRLKTHLEYILEFSEEKKTGSTPGKHH